MVSAGVSVATVAENSTGLCGGSCGGNGGGGHDPLHRRADSVIDDRRRDVGFISRKGAGGGNGGDSEQGKQSFFIRDSSISKSQKSRGAGRRNNPVRRASSESSFSSRMWRSDESECHCVREPLNSAVRS